jgi:hypothetical protein
MARRLAPAALAVCRFEYETTGITLRDLAARHGVGKSSLAERAGIEGWLRLHPRQPKRRRPRRAEMAVRASVQLVEDIAIAGALKRTLDSEGAKPGQKPGVDPDTKLDKRPRAIPDKKPIPALVQSGTNSAPLSCDRPEEPISGSCKLKEPPLASPWELKADKPPIWDPTPNSSLGRASGRRILDTARGPVQRAEIVPFQSLKRASPCAGVVLPKRRQDDPATLRVEIAALRGLLTDHQLAQLNRHQRLLEDYSHLLQLYLAPREILDLDAMPEAERELHVARIRQTALALLLPTKKDSLAITIKNVTVSMLATMQVQRMLAGVDPGKGRENESANRERPDLSKLDTQSLVRVHEAMQLLSGACEPRSAPPIPPPPPPIEDLRSPPEPPRRR